MRYPIRATVLLLVFLTPVPSSAAVRKHGFGIGWSDARLSSDGEFSGHTMDLDGFTAFGKFGISDRWGILVSYRDLEDKEDPLSNKIGDITQIGVYGVILGRASKRVRPFFKFGLVRTDIDAHIRNFWIDDEDTFLSIGLGMEVGSQSLAFYADYDVIFFDVGPNEEDFGLGVLTLGLIFKPWE